MQTRDEKKIALVARQARMTNKAVILAALAAMGAASATVEYSGCGDEGAIESCVILDTHNKEVTSTDATVEIIDVDCYGETKTQAVAIEDALQDVAYEALGANFGDWQDNEGAYGTVVFDIATGALSIDHNERYTSVENTMVTM
ncbi:MAG: hypothetical protein EPN64_13165 [Burkholderiaceae bacterium]|nr:MAG: hypothetical protein EPN64_13165 [Burkholderiaceae bacterium]